ncbi:MAG: LysR family transcriptional regulator [Oscillospiraceae bacterium]|nr:LysR family transcriptional regulator [Oscillospiraceae bacterium]
MDLTVLRHFLVIADNLSFTKAAEILDKSESVLSRQMSRLEAEVGTPLFYRVQKGVSLTPAGMIFRKSIVASQKQLSDAISEMHAISNVKKTSISIGIIQNHYISRKGRLMFSSFTEEYPDISLKYFSFTMNDLIQFLKDGKIDFVYGALADFVRSDSFHTIGIDTTIENLLVSRNNPILNKGVDSLSLSDFQNEVFLITQNHRTLNELFFPLSLSFGFEPKIEVISDQTELLAMVQFGKGITFSDDTSIYNISPYLETVSLPELGSMPLGLIGRNAEQSVTNQALIKYANQWSATH